MNLTAEIIGYIAIGTGFFAISKNDMTTFRIWHLISSFFYIIYGLFLNSYPLVIAGAVFCIIHAFHLNKIRLAKKVIDKSTQL